MICVDSSVAAKWLFDEEHSEQADALLTDLVDAKQAIVAPALLHIEITNIICQHIRGGLRADEGERLLMEFSSFPIDVFMPPSLQRDALRLAVSYNLPATYDAQYLALSQELGVEFWTADQRLLHALGGKVPTAHWIGDYSG